MNQKERFEMQMLVPQLRALAGQVERALKVIDAADTAQKLLDQVASLAAPRDPQSGERNSAIAEPGSRRRHEVDARGGAPVAPEQNAAPAAHQPTAATAARRPTPAVERRELRSPTMPERGSRVAAVFDVATEAIAKHGKICGGRAEVPF